MTSFALAMAASSSPRLFVSASKSSALVMHSWWRSPKDLTSAASSLEVTPRSPSALAFVAPAPAMPALASSISFWPYLISSLRDCCNISKAWVSAVSFFLAASSCSSASSMRPVNVSTMLSLWLSYTAPAGAPTSSPPLCTNAVILRASAVLIAEAWTKAFMACTRPAAFFNCSIAEPPFLISRSMMEMARWRVSTVSESSFSDAAKAACSVSRMCIAALRSASSVESSEASFSKRASREETSDSAFAMVALRSATSPSPVLISKESCLERSSHHSENSA
mmetsp:Transcript_49010/g.136322  ORF Transcript_49010/g.136322 Transcript_49010/m.136322 type:complete len:280 (-) Transcript_49010:219-1058(-)